MVGDIQVAEPLCFVLSLALTVANVISMIEATLVSCLMTADMRSGVGKPLQGHCGQG